MKIALFTDNFYPELSGISDSIIVLARELARRGHAVRIYTPRYGKRDYERAKVPFQEIALGDRVRIVRLPALRVPGAPTGQGRAAFCGIRGLLDIYRFAPDVIHTQLFFGVGLSALFISRLLRKPLVGTNHTAIKEFAHYISKYAFVGHWLEKYVVWYYNRCLFVTGPSESVLTEMVAAGFKAPHRALSNPVAVRDFALTVPIAERAVLKKKFGLTEHTLVYAGRLAREKNVDEIISALALMRQIVPDACLALAGHGAALTELRAQAEKLGVVVKFLGFLKKDELVLLYQAAEIFTIMSRSETQGLSMMQAMAAGLPVIAARARALPEYVNAENGILVEHGDVVSLARAAAELFQNNEKRAALGRGGQKYVQRFSPENIAAEWEKIYEKAAFGLNN
ncbi:MAG: glycosyltransferase [Candidatus Niyogibacteria bacterium]|nr:glycosyltransferase [Candidatus Niyogibacteria bacterium]